MENKSKIIYVQPEEFADPMLGRDVANKPNPSGYKHGNWGEFISTDALLEITSEMKAVCIGDFNFEVEEECPYCFNKDKDKLSNCDLCEGYRTHLIKKPIPWTTIKEIYQAMISAKIKEIKNEMDCL